MIKGQMLRDAFISAANNIANHKQEVDALNVFPVPDGDTGTNMSMTTDNAKRVLERIVDTESVAKVAADEASALLRGARGNSGVILSLLFRGFSKGLAGKETANAEDMVNALDMGVASAYKAVMKPTEGTILTVARLAAVRGKELVAEGKTDVVEVWQGIIDAANVALESTPELLPVLKKAGVVDAGGKGLVYIFEGMQSVFAKGEIIQSKTGENAPVEIPNEKNAAGLYEGEITFTYCTEFTIMREDKAKEPDELRAYLQSIGDSVVVVDDDDIIKCHVHTDNPGNAMQSGLKLGALIDMKIENMREQHANKRSAAGQVEMTAGFEYKAVDPSNAYGIVAVAAGQGIIELFKDLGVQNVVTGGQTMNPSTEDILSAIHATPAKTVFVLPNNKNIIMAAEQAAPLADRKVVVLPTRTIPQGLAALLAFEEDSDLNQNLLGMTKGFEKVGTAQVTFAARDSEFDGHKIKQGEILALENGKLAFTERDIVKAAVRLTRSLIRKDGDKNVNFITIIYGEDTTEEQAQLVADTVKEKLPEDVEVTIINGGQPIYYFIISVE